MKNSKFQSHQSMNENHCTPKNTTEGIRALQMCRTTDLPATFFGHCKKFAKTTSMKCIDGDSVIQNWFRLKLSFDICQFEISKTEDGAGSSLKSAN